MQDKYEALAELLKDEETAKAIWGNTPEEAQTNLKEKGLDFSVEELLEMAQPPEGEISESELDNVSGGIIFGGCFWPPRRFPFPWMKTGRW